MSDAAEESPQARTIITVKIKKEEVMKGKLFVFLLAALLVMGVAGSGYANSTYFNAWKAAYPTSATVSSSCSICHTSAPALNGYGDAVLAANSNFASIEQADSDNDGATNIAEITAGTNPGDPASKPATPPPPAACTDYTYSAWSACDANGQQTRTVIGNTPDGCSGTPSAAPVLTQSCTPAPVACADYTYSAWSACANGQQTRTVIGNTPEGCTGTPSATPVLTQSCGSTPVACTDYTYSEWSACANGQQTRTVTGNTPSGCTGTPSAAAVLTQSCTVTPPPPSTQTMPLPSGQQVFFYLPVDLPVVSADPAQAKPIGVGPIAAGGNSIVLTIEVGPFAGPVNVSMILYAPAVDSEDLYFMSPGIGLKKLSDAVEEENDQEVEDSDKSAQDSHEKHDSKSKKFRDLVLWKKNVTSVNEGPFTARLSDLPSGMYPLIIAVSSPEDAGNSYRWMTYLLIP